MASLPCNLLQPLSDQPVQGVSLANVSCLRLDLYDGLAGELRQLGHIVIIVASSGIASILLPGGRTAHSRFKLPLNVTEDSTCNIPVDSHLHKLIERAV